MKKLFRNLRAKAGIGFLLSARKIEKLFFYLLILFIPTQLGRHFWPAFASVFGIRIDYLSPTLYATDILIVFLFSLSFAKFLNWLKSKFFIFYFLFFIFLFIGIVLSKSPWAGFYGLVKLLEFIFLGFYVAENVNRQSFRKILLIFSAGLIFESALAIMQFFNKGSLNGIFYFFGERYFNSQTPGIANAVLNGEVILRPYGTFSHPNVLAGYLAVAMITAISNIKYQTSNLWRIFYSCVICLGTIALLLTLSRVTIILWVIILVFYFIRKFINHKSYILILLAGLLILGLVTPLRLRFTNLSLANESVVQRKALAESSLLMIEKNPIFGVGLNNFLTNLPYYQKQANPLFYLQPVHNIYLLITTETGIIGLGFFVWFLIKTYKKIMNHESRIMNGNRPLIQNSLFIILSSALVLGLFDHYFLTLQQGQLLFSLVLGFSWAFNKNRKR